ncbi:hypothetical protein P4562_09550 [Lysinibacillus xylanilyticus]|uniref:hypothetical protein n=1 Tax=Lysinibacillus xylanilyticus TaxID=582475 RepID=UPI002E209526|nr:hypothetical protein [Lysinibacillus xylanilyticus]
MEQLILLLFGEKLPPSRHLHKLSNKFINLFLKEREKESFRESDYYVVYIEEYYFGDEQRKSIFPPAIPVHKDFLHQVQSIYGNLNAEMVLCTMQHEHPIAYIDNIKYEGYCYYAKDSNEKILFFDTDKEPLTKFFIKLPQETNASKAMRRWLLSNI